MRDSDEPEMTAMTMRAFQHIAPGLRLFAGAEFVGMLGRELDRKPGILVVNQPTWGVDAGAAATIRQALIDLSRSGSAVLVISQDLDEIFEVADRIAVISRGQLSEAQASAEMSAEKIGLLMAGAHETREHAHAAGA